MHKVYLLLRNNQKTGPFSLDELLQLQLKPFDLVWVEGRSAGWRYPSEIDSLKAFVVEAPKAPHPFEPLPTAALEQKITEPIPVSKPQPVTPKKVFVSMPGRTQPSYKPASNEIEMPSAYTPAEEYKNEPEPIPQYAPGYQSAKPAEEISYTKYARPVNDVEEDYTKWIVQKKKKKPLLTSKNLVALLLVIAVVATGYFMFQGNSNKTPVLARQDQTQNQNSSTAHIAAAPEQAAEQKTEYKQEALKKTPAKEKNSKQIRHLQKQNAVTKLPAIKPKNEPIDNKAIMKAPADDNSPADQAVVKEESKTAPETINKEKKKKLGEKIRDIFSKPKAKKEEPKTEVVIDDPKPATNRQSTKREGASDATNTAPLINIADQVDITSNAPDNWMMGVKGLKVTMRNRSNATIQSASVDVIYFDENNRVLDRKAVYFTNIAPKGKLTVAAPDHKYADHVEFKLGTITAKDDRFAQN